MDAIAKAVLHLYDMTTLPIYYLVQRPWKTLEEANISRAQQVSPNNPKSPWIRNTVDPHPFAKGFETVDGYLRAVFSLHSDQKCLGFRSVIGEETVERDGRKVTRKELAPEYTWYTYAEISQRAENLMKGFLEIGVKPKDVVVILMETRVEWMLAFLALNRMGAIVATLHTTLGEKGIIYGANLVEGQFLITSGALLPMIDRVADQLNYLKTVVFIKNFKDQESSGQSLQKKFQIFSLSEVQSKGEQSQNQKDICAAGPDDTVLIMFTSGSTGTPKGVVAHNKGLINAMIATDAVAPKYTNKQTYMGFLPLAHILEFIVQLTILGRGASIGYSSPSTMMDNSPGIKQGCRGDVVVLKPVQMPSVPLILDKLKSSILEKVQLQGSRFAQLFQYAIGYKQYWRAKGYSTPLLDAILFRKFNQILGGKVKIIYNGGAPLSIDTHKFIETVLCVDIPAAYGATENMCPATSRHWAELSYGKVSFPLGNIQIKLVAWPEGSYYPTDTPNPRGEIHIGGKSISKGYYKNEELTKEAFYEEDGLRWFRTGDIGEMYPNGSLKVIDRAKDIVKLKNGEFVCLGKIEAALKNNEYVENICAYANPFSSYIIALISPNTVSLQKLGSELGKGQTDVHSLCNDDEISDLVVKSLKNTALTARLSRIEMPQKLILCPEEWSPSSGLLTGALKVKRKQIYCFYDERIKGLYDSKTDSNCNYTR